MTGHFCIRLRSVDFTVLDLGHTIRLVLFVKHCIELHTTLAYSTIHPLPSSPPFCRLLSG